MILRVIENIRQKSNAVRQRYAFVTAVTFTVIVAGIWSLSLPARFSTVREGFVTASPEITSQTANAPFSGVWAEFKQQIFNRGGENFPASTTESSVAVSSSTIETQEPTKSDSVSLPSGSTIRFGTQAEDTTSSAIMLGTTSITSTTSSEGQ